MLSTILPFPLRLAIAATIVIGDAILLHAGLPPLTFGWWDEPAHLATAVLFLTALKQPVARPYLLGALLGALLIDLDHVPLVRGSKILSLHAGRPYSHSLVTVVAALVVGVAIPRWRRIAFGVTFGLMAHFARNLATGPLPLLWPAMLQPIHAPYGAYALLLAALVVVPSIFRRPKATERSATRGA